MRMMIGVQFQLSYDAKNKYSKKEGLRLLFCITQPIQSTVQLDTKN
jgi:hypothetical protein